MTLRSALILAAFVPVGIAVYLALAMLIGRWLKRSRRLTAREIVDQVFPK